MNAVYFNSVIDADGDYVFPVNHIPAARFEVEGDFDGASVTLGYADSAGAFVAFDAAVYIASAAKGWNVVNPISGQFAIRVAFAGAGTRLVCRYKVASGDAVTTESVAAVLPAAIAEDPEAVRAAAGVSTGTRQTDDIIAEVINTSANITPGKYVRNIALCGDSHHNVMSVNNTTYNVPQCHTGIEWYGSTFLKIVRPPARDRHNHAIGGSRVDLFIDGHSNAYNTGTRQLTEILSQVTAGTVDTVVISLGANDYWMTVGSGAPIEFDIDVSMSRYKNEIVIPLVNAGAIVVVCAIPPCEDILVPHYGTPVANAAEWSARLRAEFGEMTDVLVYDAAPLFGGKGGDLYRIRDEYLGDGSHLPGIAAMIQGRAMAAFLRQFTRLGEKTIPNTEWVSANPYQKSALALPADATFSGGASITYPARGDAGEADERGVILTAVHDSQSIGSGASGTIFTNSTAANAAKLSVLIQQFAKVNAAAISITIFARGNSRVITIDMPASSSTVPTVTAAQVKAAWDADAAAVALAACTLAGDGSGVAGYGKGIRNNELRCHSNGTADAIAVANGDYVRAYCEILPIDNEEFNATIINPVLYSGAGTIGNLSTACDATFYPYYPLPRPLPGCPITIATPWVASSGSRTLFLSRMYFAGAGRFRIVRHGVQRLIGTL